MELSGKRVLITGASRGIGEALAVRFAAAGSRVALVARSSDAIEKLAERLEGTAHPADLSDPDVVKGLVDRVEREAGPVDVLVNNAGVDGTGWFPEESHDVIEGVLRLNLSVPVHLCREVVPRMLARGGGHIVNVSSMAGSGTLPGMAAYSASKAGLSHFTAALRADLRGLPIGMTVVEIGTVPTDMLDDAKEYRPTDAGFRRLYRLRLMVDVPRETIADATVTAVERGRRTVWLPRRAALFPLLAEAPRRIAEALVTGVRHQP